MAEADRVADVVARVASGLMGLPFAFVRGPAPGASQALAARANSLEDTLFPKERGILHVTACFVDDRPEGN
jgi:hypothetical protein